MLRPTDLRNKRRLFKQRNREIAAGRRRCAPGYPLPVHLFTAEEVAAYFSGDRITCLLCGAQRRTLARHLVMIHGVQPDQYRDMYGFPYTKGLDAATLTLQRSNAVGEERRAAMKLMGGDASRPRAGKPRTSRAKTRSTISNALAAKGKSAVFTEIEFARVIELVKSGVPLAAVFKSGTAPRRTRFYEWLKENPSRQRQLDAAFEALPFPIQAYSQKLGERFRSEVLRLHARGLSDHAIARTLGVTAMSVNKVTKPLRAKNVTRKTHR